MCSQVPPIDTFNGEPNPVKETSGNIFITTDIAAQRLKTIRAAGNEYQIDIANFEKPHTHYTRPGNLFQILRFGIQGERFKKRLQAFRNDEDVDEYAQAMCGFRLKPGGSYQGKDSISLSRYNRNLFAVSGTILLVNPDVQVWGQGERAQTGYGHGIPKRLVNGDYEIGNDTAYADEVVAGNIILPEDIRAVVLKPNASILRDSIVLVREHATVYSQERRKSPEAAGDATENLLANTRLLATLAENQEILNEVELIAPLLQNMPINEISAQVGTLQRKALDAFAGGPPTTEKMLRSTLQETFGISIIEQ